MPCLPFWTRSFPALSKHSFTGSLSLLGRQFSTSKKSVRLREVDILPSWVPTVFEKAYKRNLPARLPRSRDHLPPACSKWFIHDNNPKFSLFKSASVDKRGQSSNDEINVPSSSELRMSFWSEHESTLVPLEVTTKKLAPPSVDGEAEEFERIEAPMEILLAYLSKTPTPFGEYSYPPLYSRSSIYLAQCDLSSLPESLQADVPVPQLLRPSASPGIKGDIYASSLWLGRAPTYTPLHRDPNPNLFIQLAGQKTIRLLPPDIGEALYHDVIATLAPRSASFSGRIRGEEMMVGPQKTALHDAIWSESSMYCSLLQAHCLQTTLGLGDALFTPKGWWHSVKGIGEEVTASVNWWFR